MDVVGAAWRADVEGGACQRDMAREFCTAGRAVSHGIRAVEPHLEHTFSHQLPTPPRSLGPLSPPAFHAGRRISMAPAS